MPVVEIGLQRRQADRRFQRQPRLAQLAQNEADFADLPPDLGVVGCLTRDRARISAAPDRSLLWASTFASRSLVASVGSTSVASVRIGSSAAQRVASG